MAARGAAGLLECLHDVCVVWTSEVQGQAARAGHPRELGHCAVRILFSGARQPVGQLGLFPAPAQDHAGNHHAHGVLRLCVLLFQRKGAVESLRGVCLHPSGGGLRLLAAKVVTGKGVFSNSSQ